MNLYYTQKKTKLGNIFLYADGDSLLALDFNKNPKYESATRKDELQIFAKTFKQLDEYLNGKRKNFELSLNPIGTEFQQLAWKTLLKIPYGKVMSYGEQALKMKKPKAQRATGSANGKNPLPIIIPCHRIITSDFKLGGYSGDIKLKIKLLEIEGHEINHGRVNC